ncbi:MAG: opioid growth factor receptor-related protein [Rouxiella aceris]|uniref:opioid growth factor receptor-related protein n=1 Tax=Rouxiella aceris TaxID=2703884 RepID=UPI00284B122E|nr:opioid growth factor receptor-related protein [Rouxiella aceris]MDR3431610.1 opioid growth factor receptor-related protein [Rouxiella aceris]
MINKVVLFNREIIPCHLNEMYLNEFRSKLSRSVVEDGYFYLQWMFPVLGKSKWHTNTLPLCEQDISELRSDPIAKNNILKSADLILSFFNIAPKNGLYIYNTLNNQENDYWLRGIGHEEKKISRIALSLYYIGLTELSHSLIDVSISVLTDRGFKTKRETLSTVSFWQDIFITRQIY